jgi:hypothetical protein
MDCILLHVIFEGGISISVLRNKAALHNKKEGFKTDEFSKSSNFQKPPPPPAFWCFTSTASAHISLSLTHIPPRPQWHFTVPNPTYRI